MSDKKKNVPKGRNVLYSYLLCSLFAAITAVFSQIMIPLPFTPVPINLALLAVWLCGGVIGAKRGALAILVYILLGAIGLPVFHGFTGGVGVLAGPTGGYIVGYLPAVIIFGLLYNRYINNYKKPGKRIFMTIIIGLPALVACYATGTVWFVATTGTNIIAALMMCVVPFFPGDIVKFVLAAAAMESLKKHGIILH